jgi:hypothetical protein
MSDTYYRSPVRYPVRSTSPVRIAGSTDAPFRVINLGTSTVWVSDNSGLIPGAGTPIYGGTSLQWVKPSQLWAIADTTSEILVTTEIDDWVGDPTAASIAIATQILNTGVIIVDNPVPLLTQALTGPGLSGAVDISKFQSLDVSVSLVTAAGGTDEIDLLFTDSGTTTYRTSLNFTVVGHVWTAQIPCYGNQLQFSIPFGSRFNMYVAGSHRQVSQVRQRIDVAGQPQVDLVFGAPSLVGASTTSFIAPPWHGRLAMECEVSATPAIAPSTSNVGVFVRKRTYGSIRLMFQVFSPSPTNGTWDNRFEIQCNGDSYSFTVGNATASTVAGYIRVTPVTGGLV